MRKKIVAGNWKMNLTRADVRAFTVELAKRYSEKPEEVDLLLFPSHLWLGDLEGAGLFYGAQNCSEHESGAYTGDVSAAMLKGFENLTHCLVGHSERRKYYGEGNDLLKKKLLLLLESNISPVFCFGEELKERENNTFFETVQHQLAPVLALTKDQFEQVVLAYEPVWAIGTGKTATPQIAQEMHAFVRKQVQIAFGDSVANKTSILYGGSCKPANAKELFAQTDIDGGLIGGASLKVDSFLEIAKCF